jgi:hypothetical protein
VSTRPPRLSVSPSPGLRLAPPLRRADNWPALLAAFIEQRRALPFDWRTNNCAFMACDWIAQLTGGYDPAKSYRRRCTSALTAARLLKKHGDLATLAAQGWPEIEPRRAWRGDIASTITPEGEALGIVIGIHVAHAGPNGLVFTPLGCARRAWSIA